MIEADEFKEALSTWASGVSVVTAVQDGAHYGLTVSSFCSLSLEPPLVLICLNRANRLPAMIEATGRFAVNVLAAGQEAASNHYARSGREPTAAFAAAAPGTLTDTGYAVLTDASATLECTLREAMDQGDHTIVVGAVEGTHVRPGAEPLLYFSRGYRTLAPL